jgi:hypothetical protein
MDFSSAYPTAIGKVSQYIVRYHAEKTLVRHDTRTIFGHIEFSLYWRTREGAMHFALVSILLSILRTTTQK